MHAQVQLRVPGEVGGRLVERRPTSRQAGRGDHPVFKGARDADVVVVCATEVVGVDDEPLHGTGASVSGCHTGFQPSRASAIPHARHEATGTCLLLCRCVWSPCGGSLASRLGLTDKAGDKVERYVYTPYGQVLVAETSGPGHFDD